MTESEHAGEPAEAEAISDFVRELLLHRRLPAANWPLTDAAAALLGLQRDGSELVLSDGWDPLQPAEIRRLLSVRARNWLSALEVHPVIGSTNTALVERAARDPIDGQVMLAELQVHGRGRRGRVWLSPLGGNLALSLGFRLVRPASELGGLSLVAGLAVIDALDAAGVAGLELKWPNDILLGGAKLGGILIELVAGPAATCLVIGIGINLSIGPQARASVGLPIGQLHGAVDQLPTRSALAARLISSVVEFEAGFSRSGFQPFMATFDRRHAYHRREIWIHHGEHRHFGRIEGVAVDGGLRIATSEGTRIFHGGEVSLRLQER